MAHKIDFSKGKAAFISYSKPAWHGLGKTFDTEITIENALVDAGLNFDVVKRPNIHALSNGIDEISTTSFFTERTDVNKVLGTRLGVDYTVYQNIEALALVDEMVKTKMVTIETVGAIDEGRKVFACLKLTSPIIVGTNDEVDQYVLLANSHDGSLAITAMPTNIRVVCNNTLSAALSGGKGVHKIRHTKNAHDRVKEAFEILGLLNDNSKVNAAAYNAMQNTIIKQEDFFNYIGNIFLSPEEISDLQKGKSDVLSTRKRNVLSDVINFANNGIGQNEARNNGKLNMWFALNAVTGYLTVKPYKNGSDRFESLMLGDSAKKIQAATRFALHPDEIQPTKAKDIVSLN